MSKNNTKKEKLKDNEMLPEYDFSKGDRGKHYKAYQEGHTVKVYQEDGTILVQHFTLEEGAVMLEPRIREYFPDSKAVNIALGGLISLIPQKSRDSEKEDI
ncbi:MAG: hypothetical protein ACRENO_03200 [Thermodesulfobacteriota bacterium]